MSHPITRYFLPGGVLVAWLVGACTARIGLAAGINLSWDECGTEGTEIKTFACDTNVGTPFALFGSFVAPPGLTEYLGMSATLTISTSNGAALPDWWKHGSTGCRGTTGMQTDFDFTAGPFGCADFFQGQAAGGYTYDIAFPGPNSARLRIQAAVPFAQRRPLDDTSETYAFKVEVLRSKTIGVGSCEGCIQPMRIVLDQIQLFQPPVLVFDPVVSAAKDRNFVDWPGTDIDITSFAPMAGPVGTAVTLQGTHLTGTSEVRFGPAVASFMVDSDSIISTRVPTGALTGLISLRSRGISAVSDSIFVVAPRIQSFYPTPAPIGHVITIVGENFIRTSAVSFAGTAALFSVQSNDTIAATVPAGTTDGPITVTNPGGSGASLDSFYVGPLIPPPAITRFSPTAGAPGTVVTIVGTSMSGASRVTFGGVSTGFTVTSDTSIAATVPAGAYTGAIGMVARLGSAISSSDFIVAPVIQRFEPLEAAIGSVVSILGYNFRYTSEVVFNGTPGSFLIISASEIRVTVPLGATSGPLTVTNPGGQSTSLVPLIVRPLPPTGINLSWDDCGEYGALTRTFACDSSVGAPYTLIGSFQPPAGILEYLGMTAEIDVMSSTASLPDWWRHGVEYCRGNSGLSVGFDFTAGPYGCTDFYAGHGAGGFAYRVGYRTQDRARLRIQAAVPFGNRGPIDSSREYYAFRVTFPRSKTTGVDRCGGCDVPVCLVLNNIQLFQPPKQNDDPVLVGVLDRNAVSWQATAPNCPAFTGELAFVTSIGVFEGHVRVIWHAWNVERANIERREGDGPWRAVATKVPDVEHRVAYDDAVVFAGGTYGYRLDLELPGGHVIAGETSITLPGTSTLELRRIAIDADGLWVDLSLAERGEARLEIFDLSGRRRADHRLVGSSPGPQRARVPGAGRLDSSVYFARLSQGRRHVSQQFVLLR